MHTATKNSCQAQKVRMKLHSKFNWDTSIPQGQVTIFPGWESWDSCHCFGQHMKAKAIPSDASLKRFWDFLGGGE